MVDLLPMLWAVAATALYGATPHRVSITTMLRGQLGSVAAFVNSSLLSVKQPNEAGGMQSCLPRRSGA